PRHDVQDLWQLAVAGDLAALEHDLVCRAARGRGVDGRQRLVRGACVVRGPFLRGGACRPEQQPCDDGGARAAHWSLAFAVRWLAATRRLRSTIHFATCSSSPLSSW